MCQVWIGSEYIKYTRQNSLSTVHKFVILPQSLGLEGPDLGTSDQGTSETVSALKSVWFLGI